MPFVSSTLSGRLCESANRMLILHILNLYQYQS
jgi:hypothetical protein